MSAEEAEKYHDNALRVGDYYTKGMGVWRGKLAERLNLTGYVRREDFVSLARNQVPGSEKRLTARNNKDGKRQAGYDFTLSVKKSWSIYTARNPGDEGMWDILNRANDETMALIEEDMECKACGCDDGKRTYVNGAKIRRI